MTMETMNRGGGAETPTPSFGITEYLERRANDASFVMVEFGHDALPVAYNEGQNFAQNRAYVGIEPWLRDPYDEKRHRVEQLRRRHEHLNTFYLTQSLGGAAVRDMYRDRTHYEGAYTPQTILPDGAASEVFASNVLGDPHVAESQARTSGLLAEMTRVLQDAGLIIMRETITPQNVQLNDALLQEIGIREVAQITPDSSEWAHLEQLYRADSGTYAPAKGAHYRILQKI